ncbi:uncharacterized protein LOC114869276 isoform X1 [Betta splendens]|uniref:DNA-directed DNA polymerase n=1 Tax=Betta splendens TaxID=158456 RepID=A0A9W2Y955_BETSP|nr:uncharacterized protein LOC114869276 isoform X1 [Betta splendens]
MYIVNNRHIELCFAINLAHLLYPGITDAEAERRGSELQQRAGLIAQTPVCFTDVEKFEELVQCRIVIFYRTDLKRLNTFHTAKQRPGKPLYMFLFENHYYGLKNACAFIGTKYLCSHCYTGYDGLLNHKCEGRCNVCLDAACTATRPAAGGGVVCEYCNRWCASAFCLAKHREKVWRPVAQKHASICDMHKKCHRCGLLYYVSLIKIPKPHECPDVKCCICGGVKYAGTTEPHRCYIQSLPTPETTTDVIPNKKLLFYDFETYPDENGTHVPFYVCVMRGNNSSPWGCYGPDCAVKLLRRYRAKKYKDSVCLAHNSKGFDGHILLSAMVSLGISPHVVMQGSKLVLFTEPHYNLKFIDSMSFLSFLWASLPKALGFEDAEKGHFPHKFSSKENLNYVGPYPAPEYYGCQQMTPKKREDFMAWYTLVSGGTFNFKAEAKRYCQNDREILMKACFAFRECFVNETALDPFKRATIASACMFVFRTCFLKETAASASQTPVCSG